MITAHLYKNDKSCLCTATYLVCKYRKKSNYVSGYIFFNKQFSCCASQISLLVWEEGFDRFQFKSESTVLVVVRGNLKQDRVVCGSPQYSKSTTTCILACLGASGNIFYPGSKYLQYKWKEKRFTFCLFTLHSVSSRFHSLQTYNSSSFSLYDNSDKFPASLATSPPLQTGKPLCKRSFSLSKRVHLNYIGNHSVHWIFLRVGSLLFFGICPVEYLSCSYQHMEIRCVVVTDFSTVCI